MYGFLQEHPDIPVKDIPYSRALLDNLKKNRDVLKLLEKEVYRQPFSIEHQSKHIQLTTQHKKVVDGILAHQGRVAFITRCYRSGKTEVYLALAAHYIQQNKSVMMLVPEISLTPMMVEVFRQRFGNQVAILHSRLSQGGKI